MKQLHRMRQCSLAGCGDGFLFAQGRSPVCDGTMSEIRFFNRHSGRMETEHVYGESFLRWTYETAPGRLALHSLAKRGFFSRWYGWRMDAPDSRRRIGPFVETYGVDKNEILEPLESFENFNAFFSRRLKPGARPVDASADTLVFPADGRHLLVEDAASTDFLVKGVRFDLTALLGDAALAERFRHGSLLISRLCPVDYHRFHFPAGGVAGEPKLINGPLYSVSPLALRRRPSILWENKRCVTQLEAEQFGRVLFLEIGATCVGTVVHTSAPGARVAKGDEKGYFRFGGSSVITITESGRVEWAEDLRQHSAEGVEVYARMGECAGKLKKEAPSST